MSTPSEVILKVLKDNGVELTEEIEASIKSDLNEHVEIATADKILGEGQVAIDEATRRQEKIDISKMRKRMHDAEDRTKELESTLNAGESDLAKHIETLKTKLKLIEPQYTTLMEMQTERWKSVSESIPEDAQKHFTWPEGEGATLSPGEVLKNLKQYDTFVEINAPGFGANQAEEPPDDDSKPPKFPRIPSKDDRLKPKDDITKIDDPDVLFEKAEGNITKLASGKDYGKESS